jgi:antirestriction protein ArdC
MTDTIRDVYSRITAKIMADLEQDVRPWMKPRSADHAADRIRRPLRHNGIPYKGINVMMLWSAAVTKGYACPFWLTFKQALELGGPCSNPLMVGTCATTARSRRSVAPSTMT